MEEKKEGCRVLVVDDDQVICSAVCRYLSDEGITALAASDGKTALKMVGQMRPDVVVSDLQMPFMGGLELLEEIRKNGSSVPFIIITGIPDNFLAAKAVRKGVYDYLLKPVCLPLLAQKIRAASEDSRLSRENIVLNEIASLNNITDKLAFSHNAEALLDVLFRYGLELTSSPSGIIFQRAYGDDGDLVYARQRGFSLLSRISSDAEAARCAIAEGVFSSNKSMVIENGAVKSDAKSSATYAGIHALLAVPLIVSGKTKGVFMVERGDGLPFFSPLDLARMEIIASQAGIFLCNVELCSSVKNKQDALALIRSFTGRICGRMDTYQLLRLMFGLIRERYPADVMGFLSEHQRRYEFCYWASGEIDEVDMWEICLGAIKIHNDTSPGKISPRRVALKFLADRQRAGKKVALPLGFRRYLPVDRGDGMLGVFFAGASEKCPDHTENETFVEGMVNQARIILTNKKLYDAMKENYLKTIKALAAAVDAKDHYTRGHSEKVMAMAEELARETSECNDQLVAVIRDAALLHDIGKIGIPGNILSKPCALSYEEYDGIVKKHSMVGASIVKGVPFLNELYALILHHHEHYDGSGYPHGLKGNSIPLGARILHVADAFDAMTSDRPYRSSLGHKEAIRRIVADSGKHFDPAIVGVLLRVARRKGMIE